MLIITLPFISHSLMDCTEEPLWLGKIYRMTQFSDCRIMTELVSDRAIGNYVPIEELHTSEEPICISTLQSFACRALSKFCISRRTMHEIFLNITLGVSDTINNSV